MIFKRIQILILLVAVSTLGAQEVKFGKISKDELLETFYEKDSNATAIFITRTHRSHYKFSPDNGFELITDVFERIKIYGDEAFDYATKVIPLFKSKRGREMVSNIRGMTYNLVNGKIIESELDRDGIFHQEVSEHRNMTKLVMPNVKKGSVIEYKYQIKSPFIYKIDEITVQEEIPTKNLDILAEFPEYFTQKAIIKGHHPIELKKSTRLQRTSFNYKQKNVVAGLGRENKNGFERRTLEYNENITEVTMADIPAIKDENYVSNIDNYRPALNFEIVSLSIPGVLHENYSRTWEDVALFLYQSDSFGGELSKTNYYGEELENRLQGINDEKIKIYSILNFIKQKVKWNGNTGVQCEEGVKQAFKKGSGNSADINLMLVALLKKAGIVSHPVLISTRDHGIPLFPSLDGYNYVIAAAKIGDIYCLMDATEPYSTPDVLPVRDLNWYGRMLSEDGSSKMIDIMPLKRSMDAIIMTVSIFEDRSIKGKLREQLNNHNALDFRNSYNGRAEDSFLEKLESDCGDIAISNYQLRNAIEPHKTIVQSYDFQKEDIVERIGDKLFF